MSEKKYPPKVWVKFGESSGMPLAVMRQTFEPTQDGFGWQQMGSVGEHADILAEMDNELKGLAFKCDSKGIEISSLRAQVKALRFALVRADQLYADDAGRASVIGMALEQYPEDPGTERA